MASYNIDLSALRDVNKQKDQLQLSVGSSESVKGLCKQLILKEHG
jgi:hypothetical protein